MLEFTVCWHSYGQLSQRRSCLYFEYSYFLAAGCLAGQNRVRELEIIHVVRHHNVWHI